MKETATIMASRTRVSRVSKFSGFGLWGGGNESVDGTATMSDDDDQRRDHLDDDDDEEEHDSCE